MFEPVFSQTDDMTLDEIIARLSSNDAVEAILTLGSTREGPLQPHSDYDLLVVLTEMPVPLHVLLTTVDGRLTDVLFAHSSLITEVLGEGDEEASSAYEGTLVERLKTGRVVYDQGGRIRRAQERLAGREWLVKPDERDIYYYAVHGIHYNYQQNKRYFDYDTPLYRLALDIRLHYSLVQVLLGYFQVRRIPWQGEKKAIQYWQIRDPAYLALFQQYHATTDRRERFTIYTELAERTLAPVGGMWPKDVVNVLLDGDEWDLDDVAAAADFWHSLLHVRGSP
ncbi:MAG: hypothetical protein M3220_04110 [Chloroflexota bacterium]|nr:hypothetical protein [Chloroflexota bacterium]